MPPCSYVHTMVFIPKSPDLPEALELQPDDWLTLYYYGEVLGKQGRLEEASEQFKKAAQILKYQISYGLQPLST